MWCVLILLGGTKFAEGAARVASVSGNWNATATWGGAAFPTNSDDITINAGITVTMNVAGSCALITSMGNGASIVGTNSLTLPAASSITVAAGSTATISCPIAGSATSLTIAAGTGILILSGTNTYAGTTTISTGILNIQNNNALGNTVGSTIVSLGAVLQLQGGITVGAEALTLGGGAGTSTTGALRSISGDNTWGGAITQAFNGSNFVYYGVDANSLTLIGGISSPTGQVLKVGAGTLIMNSLDNSTSIHTVNQGIFRFGPLGSIPADAWAINEGAILDINGNNIQLGAAGNKTVTLTGGTITTGTGSAIMAYSGINVIVNASTVPSSISGNLNLNTFSPTFIIADGAAADDLILSATVSNGGIVKDGSGSMTLSGTNGYAGSTTISAGTLKLGNTSALGTIAGSTSIAGGAVLDLNGINYSNAEPLSVNGTGILSGGAVINSSATGATFAGLLNLGSASSIVGGTGTITLSNTGSIAGSGFDLTLGGAAGGTVSSVIGTGTGGLIKADAGSWILSGANTYTGVTTISAGTIKLGAAGSAPYSPLGTIASGTSVSAGATLDLNGFTLGTSEPLTLNGSGVSSNGALFNSSGTAVSYNGAISLGSASNIGTTGNISLGGGITGGQDLIKVGIATLNLGNSTASLGGLTISAGTLNSTSVTMNLTGSFTNNSVYTHNNGTVYLNGSTTQILGGTSQSIFNNLTLNNPAGAILGNTETVNNTLTLTTGNLNTGSNILSFGNAATAVAGGPFSATKMIIASGGGEVRKYGTTASQATFTFPVGDNTGTAEYSPITLTFSGGTYTGYSGVKVINSKHPNNASSTNFLRRYWNVSQSGYSGFSANISANYVAADIAGSETLQKTGKYVGSLPWVKYSTLGLNTLTANGVTVLGDFTGITADAPALAIGANPSLTVCQNVSLTLTANPVGDPVFTYLWSLGGETSQSVSPSTSSAGSTVYAVTVTDGNGFTASANVTVTVYALPTITTTGTTAGICFSTGSQTTNLAYSATTSSPTSYSFDWNSAANTAGLADQGSTTFAFSPAGGTLTGIVITANTPAGSYSGTMTITNGNGCTATQAVTVTVNTLPTPLVLTGSTICASPGGNGTITSATSMSGIHYQLYDSGNAAVQSSQPGTGSGLIWSSLSAGTAYYVVATDDVHSCVSLHSNTVDVATNNNPAALSLTGSAICTSPGGNGTITSTTSVSGIHYQLYNSSGATVQSSQPGKSSGLTWSSLPAGTGYYVVATDDVHSCVSLHSNTVDVANFTNPAALVLTGSTICASPGGNGTITSGPSVTGISYQLYNSGGTPIGSGLAGNGLGLSWSSLSAGNGYYAISTNGTTACISPNSNSVNVLTNANPTISGTLIMCAGSTTQMAGSGTPASSNPWVSTSTSIATVNNSGLVSGVSAGTSVITYTDINGCTSNSTVTVKALPVITAQPTNELDCEGHIVSFNAAVTGSGLSYSWQRKYPSGTFSDIPLTGEPNVSYPSPGTIRLQNVGNSDAPDGTQYQVVITDSNNCTITSNPATLTVNEITGISPSSTNVTICQGGNYSYLVTTSYPSNVVSYQWKKWNNPGQWDPITDGGAISGTATADLVFTNATPAESGQYKVTIVFHSSGADCNVTSDSRNRTLTVNPTPFCTISGNSSVFAGSANNLYTSTPNPSDNVIHSWGISGNGTISGSVSGSAVSVNATGAGSFTLTDNISRLSCTSSCTNVVTVVVPCSISPVTTSVPNGTSTTYTAPAGMDTYNWSISGNGSITSAMNLQTVTVLAGNNCSAYTLNLALTIGGSGTNCSQTVNVTDNQPPTFIAPAAITECVESLFTAIYNGATMDINPGRPDYFTLEAGNTLLDLTGLSDNCCASGTLQISWRIDFNGGAPASITGTGQPSSYGSPIQFPGDGTTFLNLTHTITYWVTDCNGNFSSTRTTIITIKPRPNVIKQN